MFSPYLIEDDFMKRGVDSANQDPPRELLTLPKVLLMLWPSVVMMVMQATRIRASMTAYSTAVGPSSLVRNWRTRDTMCDMRKSSTRDVQNRWVAPLASFQWPSSALP